MIKAFNEEKTYIQPNYNVVGFCPVCGEKVFSKCGDIKSWHFSHYFFSNCDSWGDGESDWHINWKNRFPLDNQEVIIGNHRADVKINGLVIEFQNSFLSVSEILEREKFYGSMIWVVNLYDSFDNFIIRDKGGYVGFRWKWAKQSWFFSDKPLFLDFGLNFGLLEVKKLYSETCFSGWGYIISYNSFVKRIKNINGGIKNE